MHPLTQRTIGDLVAEDYRRATVFKQYGIDFCCGGGKTLEAACDKKGIKLSDIQRALEAAERRPADDTMRPATWSLDFLATYIVNQHHTYIREHMPFLQEFVGKVARVHGDANPEVIAIDRLLGKLSDDLSQHMMKEEQVLFPHILALVATRGQGYRTERPPFGTVRNPIRMMEHEHDQAGEIMREIRALSNNFTPPEYACATYRVSYAKLAEFEDDLHRHVHLENNILFPGAAALEAELMTDRPG